ncbi:MAG: NF038143 family protein [Thermodesulfobacteriota bacterium]
MEKKIPDKAFSRIEKQEKDFVRRVVYLLRAYTPGPWWHVLIPFRFVLEYLTRKREIKLFSKTHLYLKHLALSAAYQDLASDDPAESDARLEAGLRDYWLHMQDTKSQEIYEHLSAWTELLRKHYFRMLNTGETNYGLMLQNAYFSGSAYKEFLDHLADRERQIDRVMLGFRPLNEKKPAGQWLVNKQKAFAQVRDREIREAWDRAAD